MMTMPPMPVPERMLKHKTFIEMTTEEQKQTHAVPGKKIYVYWTDYPVNGEKSWRPGEIVGVSRKNLGGTHNVFYDADKKRGKVREKDAVSEDLLGTGTSNEAVRWKVAPEGIHEEDERGGGDVVDV
jgi:hypothetical protein